MRPVAWLPWSAVLVTGLARVARLRSRAARLAVAQPAMVAQWSAQAAQRLLRTARAAQIQLSAASDTEPELAALLQSPAAEAAAVRPAMVALFPSLLVQPIARLARAARLRSLPALERPRVRPVQSRLRPERPVRVVQVARLVSRLRLDWAVVPVARWR
jgi:hypothetical protein